MNPLRWPLIVVVVVVVVLAVLALTGRLHFGISFGVG